MRLQTHAACHALSPIVFPAFIYPPHTHTIPIPLTHAHPHSYPPAHTPICGHAHTHLHSTHTTHTHPHSHHCICINQCTNTNLLYTFKFITSNQRNQTLCCAGCLTLRCSHSPSSHTPSPHTFPTHLPPPPPDTHLPCQPTPLGSTVCSPSSVMQRSCSMSRPSYPTPPLTSNRSAAVVGELQCRVRVQCGENHLC